jgi:hypothetical protein
MPTPTPAREQLLASYRTGTTSRTLVSQPAAGETIRLLDIPDASSPHEHIYLIEPALPADEVDAVVEDYIDKARQLGHCPMANLDWWS